MNKFKKGFTLVELLIVIAIVAILATATFIALDPLTRFRDSRDARRWADVVAIADAIKLHQVDNGGTLVFTDLGPDGQSVIGTDGSGCDTICGTAAAACVDPNALVSGGYLGSLPTSPNGTGSWTAGKTGYKVATSTAGNITISACEAENAASISVTR